MDDAPVDQNEYEWHQYHRNPHSRCQVDLSPAIQPLTSATFKTN
jgi:hypothetical protein